MIRCGSQCIICDYPVHFDTYEGCEHGCVYCYVRCKHNLKSITVKRTTKSLKAFITGKRNKETRMFDWDIPLHWGGNSDPFQPLELIEKQSLKCLEIFADSGYPFIVSTKNPVMLTKEPYLSLISRCKCVLQVSLACSKYDKLEPGTPTYEERLKAISLLSDNVLRVIARVRPYFPDCHAEILVELPRYAEAGIYGISLGAFHSKKKQVGMTNYSGMYMFDVEYLLPRFKEIRDRCHELGMAFFCCESDLYHLSDELPCCGTKGLEGFKPNTFNVLHMAYDSEMPVPTEAMKATNTFQPFKGIGQSQAWALKCKNRSFADLMLDIGTESVENLKESKERWH